MICYFSATGNCGHVAKRLAEATGERAVSIEAANANRIELGEGERLGLVSPTYCWGLPTPVIEFLCALEVTGRPTYCYFVGTYGTTSGQIGRFASKLLAEKGDFMRAKVPYPLSWAYHTLALPRMQRTDAFSVDVEACIGCGLCARGCPAHAITMREGRPAWTSSSCYACLRCLHRCPKFAIQRGGRTRGHGQYTHG